ncbi:SH3 domain-containing protein [Sphingobacterium sp. HMA12]|uniref:SH3 domain-containing protein n=1 Tax=Sphingobacterium sp. HMA12 TaxID=2050894 RepID=UPI000CE9FE6B|nr:SH3 domain-containing protein [Sphingobacterium sp. HMA12]
MTRSTVFLLKKALFVGLLANGLSINTFAQKMPKIYYAILSEGVNLYENPSTQANALTTVAYGSQVTFSNSDIDKLEMVDNPVVVNDTRTYWMKVIYNNVSGYVVKNNFASIKPPEENTGKLSDWIKQLSRPAGNKWESGKISESLSESEHDNYLSRQIFQNGMLLTVTSGYDINFSETLQIPHTDVLTVYNLIKNIRSFYPILKLNTALREENAIVKDNEGNEYKWKISHKAQEESEDKVIKSIEIIWNNGINNTLSISAMGSDVVVFYENTL